MSDLLISLALATSLAQDAPQQTSYEGGLVVEWKRKRLDAHPRKVTFTDGVKATYGPTVLYADTLTLHLDGSERRGEADGHVRVEDPDGRVTAAFLSFDWANRVATGRSVHVEIGPFRLDAKDARLDPEKWVFTDVVGSPCTEKAQHITLKASKVTVEPNVRAVAERAQFFLFGKRMANLPKYSFGLRRGAEGFKLPQPSFSRRGLGAKWASTFTLDPKLNLGLGMVARPGDPFSGRVELTRSLAGPAPGFAPRWDLAEPFYDAYFDNVTVMSPLDESISLGGRRTLLSVGSSLYQSSVARRQDDDFTKPIELVLEDGRALGGFNLTTQVRGQSIRARGGHTSSRLVGSVGLGTPFWDMGKGLYAYGRFDFSGYLSEHHRSSWLRGQVGVAWRPDERFRIGLAYSSGSEFGSPLFDADVPYTLRAFHLRTDLDIGPTDASLLLKYDPETGKWYDAEVRLSQIAGCIEPYLLYRKFPDSFAVGFRFRSDDLLEIFQRRSRRDAGGSRDSHRR